MASLIFLSGCYGRKLEMDRANDLPYVHKHWDNNGRTISIGMTKEEVIHAWGEPSDKHFDASDGFWIYTKANKPCKNGDYSYRVKFKDNKVEKISEFFWKSGRWLTWKDMDL